MFYGAWRNSWILLSLGAFGLSTSWFWFPRPQRVQPWVERFIDIERRYITPPWSASKVNSLVGVLTFVIVGLLLFWFHSLKPALILMSVGGLLKSYWSISVAGKAGFIAAAFGVFWALLAVFLYSQID